MKLKQIHGYQKKGFFEVTEKRKLTIEMFLTPSRLGFIEKNICLAILIDYYYTVLVKGWAGISPKVEGSGRYEFT